MAYVRFAFIMLICSVTVTPILAEELLLDLKLPGTIFLAGSPFKLDLDIVNIGSERSNVNIFVALDVGTGDYWFYPSWVKYPPAIDMKTTDIDAFSRSSLSIIPEFIWPDGTGSYFSAAFIAAILSDTGALISNVTVASFGWTSDPIIDHIDPASRPPGKPLRISGHGFNLSLENIRVAIDDYRFPVISNGVDADGIEYVITIIPPMDPGTYAIRLVVDDIESNPVALTVQVTAPTDKPPGQVINELDQGMTVLLAEIRTRIIPDAVNEGLITSAAQADYLAAISRAETLFIGFQAELSALPEDQQLLFESVMVQNKLDEIFSDLANRSNSTSRSGDLSGSYVCLGLDATSACLTAIDKAWSAVDLATILATIVSGGACLPVAGGSFGLHFALTILDAVLDGFFPIDLVEIKIEGAGNMLPASLYLTSSHKIQGVFDNQEPPLAVSFEILLSTFLEGFRPFIPTNVDEQFRNWIIGQLAGMGFSMGEGIMGENIMAWGDPQSQIFYLDFDLYLNLDLNELLAMTIFSEVRPIVTLLNYFNMGTLPETGISVGDPNVLEFEAEGETLLVRGKMLGSTVLIFEAFSFSVADGWWNILGLEIPGEITHFQAVGVSTASSFTEIPAGGFVMGSADDEMCRFAQEGPEHQVTLTHGFLVQRTEVTQAQWTSIFSQNPSDSRYPIVQVTWYDACIYCNRLSELSGLTPCYYRDAGFSTVFDGNPPVIEGPVYWNRSADGYRLPTEAEWEYACRAGTSTPYNNGRTNTDCYEDSNLNPVAWYAANSGSAIHEAGLKQPNNWGLYDMHGNMGEFCWDFHDSEYYEPYPVVDPTGPSDGTWRVFRGGHYISTAGWCRSATRNGCSLSYKGPDVGFRLVRTLFE